MRWEAEGCVEALEGGEEREGREEGGDRRGDEVGEDDG